MELVNTLTQSVGFRRDSFICGEGAHGAGLGPKTGDNTDQIRNFSPFPEPQPQPQPLPFETVRSRVIGMVFRDLWRLANATGEDEGWCAIR
jgi:hypothetical protein